MEGAALAAKRHQDGEIALAWHTAAFGAAAQNGKLKKLSHYIKSTGPRKQQTPEQMLAVLRGFEKHGMTIRRVN